ncbi:MAG TPA: hypothetical protein VLL95_04850 [Phnomibacter sp.]|nr:hypothetical protein [Phnomibacter sp.]
MKRRPFLRKAGFGIASIPLAMKPGAWKTSSENSWKAALQALSVQCKIKTVPSFMCFQFMPAVPNEVKSGEFKKADDNYYFYNEEQCCFRVFEKTHHSLGVIALLIPFWAKQADGSWKKVACLSQYELQALASACKAQPQLEGNDLLPVYSERQRVPYVYHTRNGRVDLQSKVDDTNAIACQIQVVSNEEVLVRSSLSMSASGMA